MSEPVPPGPVSAALADLVSQGALSADPLQAKAALVLDDIALSLASHPRQRGLFAGLTRRTPVRGAYLVGQVGRGKTMLMDLFFKDRKSVV